MINYEELTAWLLAKKSKTLHHAELARRRNDHRYSAELTLAATVYTDVIEYIQKYAEMKTHAEHEALVDCRRQATAECGAPIQGKYTLPETVVDIKK